MKRILAAAALLCGTAISAQEASRDLTAQFVVPDGLEVRLWAESPQLYNPTAIDVDHRGRLWVTEAVNYRTWNGGNRGRRHPPGDRVVILEDTDGDGVCDRSTVFAQDEDLVAPLGICVLGEKVFVSCSPSVLLYTDDDGDDVPDRKEVFLTGFGGRDHDHGLHSLVVGPDGWLYGAAGNAGPHIVTDKSGWTMRVGSIYGGGQPPTPENRPGLRSDDGKVWVGGILFRVRVDGTGLQVMAHNFRNQYEVALDAFGQMYTADNDDDGNRACRTIAVLDGGNYGYASSDGSRSWRDDRRPGQDTPTAHWHQEDPGVMPAGTINGAGGPTGVAVYEGGLLPEAFIGIVLNCDAGRSTVYGHFRRPALPDNVFLASRKGKDFDKGHWFRPSDVAVGTDGAVYVSDWWDPGVGGHAAGDRKAYGRILRVAPKGDATVAPRIDLDTIPGLVATLNSPAVNVRGLAWHKLEAPEATEAVKGTVLPADYPGNARYDRRHKRLNARYLWWRAAHGEVEEFVKPARKALYLGGSGPQTPSLRGQVFRALRRCGPPDAAARLAEPSDFKWPPATELLLGLRGSPLANWKQLTAAAEYLEVDDRTQLEAFGLACEGKEEELYPILLAKLGDQPLAWSERFAKIAWPLHPRAAIPAFLTRAMASSLTEQARRDALTALGLRPERQAAEAMLAVAQGGPDDVRALAGWWVKSNAEHRWREFGLTAQLGGERADAELRWRSGMLKAGTKTVDIPVTGAQTLWLVVEDGADNRHDWANWIEPHFVTPDGEVPLRLRDCSSTEIEWGQVHDGKNCDGGPLVIDGKTYERGIGTHAFSEICVRVPAGATRFLAVVGPDDSGSKARGSHTEHEYEVYTEARRGPHPELVALRKTALDLDATLDARLAAARELAADPEGGLLLIAMADTLPAAIKTAVTPDLHRNPDVAVRALATQHFPRADRPALPSIPSITALRGNRRNGQKLFFGRAACATCHAYGGRGIGLGPDLTAIHTKLDRTAALDAILNPSAAISFGDQLWTVTTDDQTLYGYILAEGDNVVLKDTNGQRHVVPADQIRARHRQPTSLMPDSIALGLSTQELADLAAFLTHDAEASRKLGPAIDLLADGLDRWHAHLADPKVSKDAVWSLTDGILRCEGTPAGYLRTDIDYVSFVLTLEWRFPPGSPPGNSGVLLRAHGPDKIWPKSIEAQLHSGHAGDLWNIDAFPMQVSEARTNGRHTTKRHPTNENPPGEWNRYEIILDDGDLTLTVNGLLQNRATFCQLIPGKIALQSEGCAIEFRNLILRPIGR